MNVKQCNVYFIILICFSSLAASLANDWFIIILPHYPLTHTQEHINTYIRAITEKNLGHRCDKSHASWFCTVSAFGLSSRKRKVRRESHFWVSSYLIFGLSKQMSERVFRLRWWTTNSLFSRHHRSRVLVTSKNSLPWTTVLLKFLPLLGRRAAML